MCVCKCGWVGESESVCVCVGGGEGRERVCVGGGKRILIPCNYSQGPYSSYLHDLLEKTALSNASLKHR